MLRGFHAEGSRPRLPEGRRGAQLLNRGESAGDLILGQKDSKRSLDVRERLGDHGFGLVTPGDHASRGSQVCLSSVRGSYEIVQALIARGVIGDYRAPDILRFGFTPLYLRFVDVWDAVEQLGQVLGSGEWQQPDFARRNAVT